MTRLETDLARIRTLSAGIRELQLAQELLARDRRELVRFLREQGVTLRQIAVATETSYQRVGQL